MPSTTSLFLSRSTRSTRPVDPLSSPVTTRTMSPLRISIVPSSYDLGRQADDPPEVPLAQFAGDSPEDAGTFRVLFGVDDDHRVMVEADVRPVVPPGRPLGPHDHAADHVAGL